MPTDFLSLDTGFPSFTGKESTEQKIDTILNYQYQLLEQLRYSFRNIGTENFNETEFEEIVDIITEPVYASIKDTDGNVATLMLAAESLGLWIQDVENNVATLTLTSEALMTRVQSAEGNIASLTLTANGLNSTVSELDGSVSRLTQTVNGITLQVSGDGVDSTIALYRDGVAVSSGQISLSGYVSFESLEDAGSITTINGAEVNTGTITGCTYNCVLESSGAITGDIRFYWLTSGTANTLAGGLRLDMNGAGTTNAAKNRLILYTGSLLGSDTNAVGIKIQSAGNLSIDAGIKGVDGTTTVIAGKGVYIGATEGTSQIVMIGGTDSQVYLNGAVYINNVKQ